LKLAVQNVKADLAKATAKVAELESSNAQARSAVADAEQARVDADNALAEQWVKDMRDFVLCVTLTHAGQVTQVSLPGGRVLSGVARPGGVVEVR